ncbi:MAG TPA: single-stranded-DNA-specific exonuclease RecJ [bacterium]|nr:single-stranded-DNA-specific exonuclease RecJ [bacterium]
MSKCKWNVISDVTDKARDLSVETGLSTIVCQVLLNRGYSDKTAVYEYLNPSLAKLPDPFLLSDLEKGSKRIADAVINGEKISVYGDYDIDGSTATASLTSFLRSLGANVMFYQPERFVDGYGFHINAVDELRKKGVSLIITVDCGTSDIQTAEYCKKNGIDLIVTDHHKVSQEYPQTFAFINPHKMGEEDIFSDLSGVGVAYYFMIGIRKVLRDIGFFNDKKEPDLKEYLDMVAFGTIADLVPIQGINRILVKKGLEMMNNNPRLGLNALIELSSLKDKLTCESVGFVLSPRMNAAGRMGSASRCVELLLTNDEHEAKNLAQILQEENNKRMNFQKRSWEEICSFVEAIEKKDPEVFSRTNTITLSSKDWHQGIIGILASKSVDRWFKPTAVFTEISSGVYKGSARSVPGIDLFKVFSELKELFEDFGGHQMAVGMSIKEERIPEFKLLFESSVEKQIHSCPSKQTLNVDLELKLGDIDMKVLNDLSRMEPFGTDNPSPLFLSKAKVLDKKILKGKHLKLKLENGIDAIGFNMGESAENIGAVTDIVFRPSINEWNGTKRIQYVIVDIL